MKETRLRFFRFTPYEDGTMAEMETADGMPIPVNVYADPDTVFFMHAGTVCSFPVYAIGNRRTVELYRTPEEYERSGNSLLNPGMIPMGTFSPKENDGDFKPSPHIELTGTVTAVHEMGEGDTDRPNYCLETETLGMTVYVYLHWEKKIEPGFVLHCVAWLFGDVAPET